MNSFELNLRGMVEEVVTREVNDVFFSADSYAEATKDAVASGVPADAAVKAAAKLVVRRRKCGPCGQYGGTCYGGCNSGMGDVITSAATNPVIAQAREAITPWLWVFSIAGFGMAVLNSRRIARMYGGWKAGKLAVKRA